MKNRKERTYHRKNKRNKLYKEAITLMKDKGIPLGHAMKIKKGKSYLNVWPDPNSPTGWTQYCDYQTGRGGNTCQSPCCGDC